MLTTKAFSYEGITIVTWDQVKLNWNSVSDKIKLTWGKFTEDDLATIAGQQDQFVRLLQDRYGYDKAIAVSAVNDFAERLDS